ncbi:MAG: hypothetical protein ACK493_13905 [Planctomycetota bacterium]|jgi:hypothetical protein
MVWWCGQVTGFGSEALRILNAPGLWLATSLLLVMVVGSWLMLRFTRLGRAHLLTKCAVLSLLAHGLFAIYAWRTYFVPSGMSGNGGGTMMVRLIEQSDQTAIERETPAELPVWEQFAELGEMPEVEPLARPIVEPELEVERVFEPVTEPAEKMSADDVALSNPMDSIPEVKPPELVVPDLLPAVAEKSEPVAEVADVVEPAQPSEKPVEMASTAPAPEAAPAEPEPAGNAGTEPAESEMVSAPPDAEPRSEPDEVQMPPTAEAIAGAAADLMKLPSPPTKEPIGQTVPAASAGNSEAPASGLVPLEPRVPARPAAAAVSRAMPAEYSERSADRRGAAVAARGGNDQTEQAVELALAWLASQQQPDGRWDPRKTGGGVERLELGQDRRGAGLRADNGITGLALLAFLGAGHTPQAGQYRETVARGLEYLAATQSRDGFLGGPALNFERTYCHGMALLALGEALAMTGDDGLRSVVQRGVAYTINTQSRQDGGWRYQPGESGDMSQFGWQVLALRSAQLGGVTTPASTRDGMLRFLEGATRGPFRGLGCYRPGEGQSPTMTAEALLCRQLLEPRVDPRTADEASSYLLQTLPTLNSVNEYYWYYGTLALYHTGGRAWELWNQRLTEVLLRRQVQAGADAGAWPADGMWAGYGGKVFSTAMSTLCLEVYYRYQPIYEQR